MSMSLEEILVAPWIGPTSGKNVLSIMVLSTSTEIIEKLSQALSEVHSRGSYKWKLVLLRAYHLEHVVEQMKITGNVSMDFVIMALDTSQVFSIEWARDTLVHVHPDLRKRRVVLVNACGLSAHSMAVDAGELLSMQDEYDFDMLSADVSKPEDAAYLAKRLFKCLEVAIGIKTGIPNLNI